MKNWTVWKHLRDYYPIKVTGYPPERLSASFLSPASHTYPPLILQKPEPQLPKLRQWGRGWRDVQE